MWQKELASATIAAQIVGMEEMGRENFDPRQYGDVDVILVDESHNFRNEEANRYLALEQVVQFNGGRGRDGSRKKVILLSATPINNDLYDLLNQVKLFSQAEPDYFRDIGIGDLNAYFRRARRQVRQQGAAAGTVLFNLLEEIIVRNTRPFIRVGYFRRRVLRLVLRLGRRAAVSPCYCSAEGRRMAVYKTAALPIELRWRPAQV